MVEATRPPGGGQFEIYVGDAAPDASRQPVLGDIDAAAGDLVWLPRFPLRPGSYRAVWTTGDGEPLGSTVLTVPADETGSATRVLGIYPSTATVAENLLRIYIQFSGPMARGFAPGSVQLVDQAGNAIAGAFVLPEQELWSPAQDRLTLLFDPGRVKQEVGPNVALGAPLRAGETVSLVVAEDWPDENGRPLAEGFQRTWSVTAADRVQPDADQWALTPPGPGSAELMIEFAAPLDRGLLGSMIAVRTDAGSAIPGAVEIDTGEQVWRFTPDSPWAPGSYEVVVDADIEDPSGNSLERLFDEPLTDEVGRPALPDVVLEFQVR